MHTSGSSCRIPLHIAALKLSAKLSIRGDLQLQMSHESDIASYNPSLFDKTGDMDTASTKGSAAQRTPLKWLREKESIFGYSAG